MVKNIACPIWSSNPIIAQKELGKYKIHGKKIHTFVVELESIERILMQIELTVIAGDHESYNISAWCQAHQMSAHHQKPTPSQSCFYLNLKRKKWLTIKYDTNIDGISEHIKFPEAKVFFFYPPEAKGWCFLNPFHILTPKWMITRIIIN